MSVNDIFGFEWCKNAFLYWPGHTDQTHSGLFTFVLGGLQFLGLVMILIYLWRQARNEAAQRKWTGDKQSPAPQSLEDPNIAANTLIFPLYVRLLWLCAASALWCGLVSILLPYNINTPNTLFLSIMYGSAWGVQHLLFEGIACLLMSYGVGSRATHRTMLLSTLWAATTMGVEFLVYYDSGSELAIWISTGWASLLFLFYSALWLAPASWIYRRPAVHSYAAFWAVTRAMLIASNLMRHFDIDFGYCVYGASSAGLLSVVVPYVIYAALLRDSRYWQGILTLKSDDLYSSNSISIRNPLLGTSLDPSSARAIAQRMDHRLHGVPILNFANLKIDQLADEYTSNRDRHVVLGAGSTSRVFRGTWQGKPVAIKMIFCVDLTPEIITKFYHEATLLSDLVHPNVVSIIGVCVLPPSICLVMELCPGGNLYDYLRSAPRLALEDQLRLACDCSRAVSYLHSHVPAILHLDLKSMNFLLGVDGSIKVADLELSREVVVQDADDDGITSIPDGDGAQTVVQHVATGSALSGYHIPDTVNWIAPEIMLGLPYNEKADVYSLAMVVWEILTGQVPFYDLQQILAKQPKPSSQPSSTRSVTRSLSSNSPRDSPRDMRSPSILSHDMPRPSPRTAITAASTDMPRPSPRTAITAASTTGFNRYAIQTTNYNLAPPHHHEHVSTTASVNSPSTVASSLSSLCSSQSDSSSLTTSPDQTSQSSYSPPAMESTLSTIRYSSSDGNLPNLPIPQHIVTSMTSASFLYNSGTPGISPSPSQSLTSTPDESQPNTQPNTQPTSPTSTSPHHLTIHVTSDAPSMPVSHSVYTTPFGSPGGFLSDDTSWGRATKGTLAIPPQRPRSSSEIYHPTSTPSRAALYRPETRDELIRRLQALQSPTTTTPACIRDRIPRMARFHIPTPSPQPTTTTTDPSPRHSRKRKSKSHKSSRSRGITSHASPRLMLTRSRDEINDELKRMICEQGVRPLIPPSCPAALASLLQRAWATDPDHRPTAAEMYQALLVIRLEVINQSNAYDQIQRGQPTLPSVHTKSVTEAIQANVALAHDERSICTPPQSAPVTIISSPSSIIHPQPSPSP